jgi:hypothetical protein
MGITLEQLIEYYPQLYHMAEDGTWESIRRMGLLSTTALLDLFEINGSKRFAIESQHRPESVEIAHPKYGTATIRDQKPMRESSLEGCLNGMTPQQWYETLNRRVFFWLTPERLSGLLSAKAYRQRKHCVLVIDTEQMVKGHVNKISLSPINSGNTLFRPMPRGVETFQPISKYPFEDRRKLRGVANAIAELAVDYHVPDISRMIIRVETRQGDRVLEQLYP